MQQAEKVKLTDDTNKNAQTCFHRTLFIYSILRVKV